MPTTALVREQAFEKIRNAIISGQLTPGRRLIEREICEAWGISRTSVREALRRVEAEGLARFIPRTGLTVALLSRKEIIEIYEVRECLEPKMLQRFAEIASDNEVAKLRKMFDDHPKTPLASDNREARYTKILEWNKVRDSTMTHIMDVVNHGVIRSISSQLIARVSVLRARTFTQPGRFEQALDEIEAVICAIEARRPNETADKARIYVRNSRNAVLSMLNVKNQGLFADSTLNNTPPFLKN